MTNILSEYFHKRKSTFNYSFLLKNLVIVSAFSIILQLFSQGFLYSQTWWKLFGDAGIGNEIGYDICQSADTNFFYIVGGAFSNIYVLKIDKYGDTIWTRKFGGGSPDAVAFGCTSSNDGGCVYTGLISPSKPFVTKINLNGDTVWNRIYSGYGIHDRGLHIERTSDNFYIVSGLDFVLKIDEDGNHIWSKVDTAIGCYGEIFSITEAFGGGYITIGYTYIPPNYAWTQVIKLDTSGNVKWQKTFPPQGGYPSKIFKLNNCYLIMGGAIDTLNNNNYGLSFSKIDSNGNRFSHHLIFDSTGKREYWYGGANIFDDNRYVFASYHRSNMIIDTITYCMFKIVDSTGNIIHRKIIENYHKAGYSGNSVLPLQNGYIMFAGDGYEYGNQDQEIFAARTDTTLYISPTNISFNGGVIPEDFILYQNYPNPFNSSTVFEFDIIEKNRYKLEIFDVLGRKIENLLNENLKIGKYKIKYNAHNLSTGIYFYRLLSIEKSINRKLVIIK